MKPTYLLSLFLISGALFLPKTLPAQTKPAFESFETDKGELKIYPILHATMVIEWDGKTIYMDPYGGAEKFTAFDDPDFVIITHVHGDHMNKNTLKGLELDETFLIAPKSVVDQLGDFTFKTVFALENGSNITQQEVSVTAVPMYNLPETDDSRHPKGWGNGYVLNLGGKHIYISGDTEDIPEMRQLKDIDIAFVCMNLPYTMDVDAAADAVLDFKPKVMYPFHYRGGGGKFSDVEKFKEIVNEGDGKIDVRLVEWYPE